MPRPSGARVSTTAPLTAVSGSVTVTWVSVHDDAAPAPAIVACPEVPKPDPEMRTELPAGAFAAEPPATLAATSTLPRGRSNAGPATVCSVLAYAWR